MENKLTLHYSLPELDLEQVKRLTTDLGITQFLRSSAPGPGSAHTLDDNCKALLLMCRHYEITRHGPDLQYINTYFNFIRHCLQPEGYFLNHTDSQGKFTGQNNSVNLADSNGKAVWALGYLYSLRHCLPGSLTHQAEAIIQQVLPRINYLHSTRAIASVIKGLYYYNQQNKSAGASFIQALADKLVHLYKHESEKDWQWFEKYLANDNSILPHALLCAYHATGNPLYRDIAKTSFDFLLSHTFREEGMPVARAYGKENTEEDAVRNPQEISYTIMALAAFYETFGERSYLLKMEKAFRWYLGSEQLYSIHYDPETGACYHGLEASPQPQHDTGSLLGYLLARLTFEPYVYREPLLLTAENQAGPRKQVA